VNFARISNAETTADIRATVGLSSCVSEWKMSWPLKDLGGQAKELSNFAWFSRVLCEKEPVN